MPLFPNLRPDSFLFAASLIVLFAFSASAQSDNLSIRIPEKSLLELGEEERKQKETALRGEQQLAVREREAVALVEQAHAVTAKTLDIQIDSANRRIKDLRQKISDDEEDAAALPGEIDELESKAEDLEREARNLWDFPDIVQPNGTIYSNRARAESLFSQAESHRTRADSRRSQLESRLRSIQRGREEIKKLQITLSAAIGKRESKEYAYRREVERVRAEIRSRALGSITTDDLTSNPGLLRQFNLGRDIEGFILDFAETAQDAGERFPLDEVLAAIESELAEAEFVKLLQANSAQLSTK